MTAVHTILVVVELDRHAAEGELERYSLGDLAGEDCARLEEHLLTCETCRQRLQEQDLIASAMSSAASQWRAGHLPRQEKAGWHLSRPVLALAAVLVVALGALWLMRPRVEHLAPAVIELSTTRGTVSAAQAPAQTPLHLRPDLQGLSVFPRYGLEVVDRIGSQVFRSQTTPDAGAAVPPLGAGTYFVRLYSPAGELLREYALEVEN